MDYSGFMNTGPNKWEPDPTSYRVPDLSLKMDKVYVAGDYLIIDTPSIDLFIIVEPYARKSYLFQTDKYTIDDLLMNLTKEGWYKQLCKECNPIEIVEPVREVLEPYEVRTRTYRKYPVITLCGSSKFKDIFREVEAYFCLKGNVVLTMNLFGHAEDLDVFDDKTKPMLDEIHRQKISMSDKIFVINYGGYIGESTKAEIEFAKSLGIPVEYMEEPHGDY